MRTYLPYGVLRTKWKTGIVVVTVTSLFLQVSLLVRPEKTMYKNPDGTWKTKSIEYYIGNLFVKLFADGIYGRRLFSNKSAYLDSLKEANSSAYLKDLVEAQRTLTPQLHSSLNKRSRKTDTGVRIPDPYFNSVKDVNDFKTQLTLGFERSIIDVARRRYLVNCSNIHEIKVGRLLGHGFYKAAYVGTFKGLKVAVKTVIERDKSPVPCVKTIMNSVGNGSIENIRYILMNTNCNNGGAMGAMFEIINHAVLAYRNVVRNLGLCVKSTDVGSNKTAILGRHIVTVFEYGEPLKVDVLKLLSWQERVRHCRELANLMELLQNSLVGSVAYTDFHERHFVMVDGTIKLIDMDFYVKVQEPRCTMPGAQAKNGANVNCSYGLSCQNGFCEGHNALFHIHTFTDMFFRPLLDQYILPTNVYNNMTVILDKMNHYEATAVEIKHELDRVLKTFSSESDLDYPIYFRQN